MRKPLIIANWKMNLGTPAEAETFVAEFLKFYQSSPEIDVAICPPFTAIACVIAKLVGSQVATGAQNCSTEECGAFTGEISAKFLRIIGCTLTIVGHSERREHFLETDAHVSSKILKSLNNKMIPVVCVGETLAERENNFTFKKISDQLKDGLANLDAAAFSQIVIAYEPIWAIGTGRTATPEQAQEVHAFIRQQLRERFGQAAEATRLLYGGSVKPGNARELMAQTDIDGALVGGASLVPKDFWDIVRAARG